MKDDPRRTSKLALIELHYEQQDEYLHWTNSRYRKLASALQLTEYELGAFLRCRVMDVTRWLETNKYPPTVELHLTMIEQSVFPTSKPPPFPVVTG